MKIKQKRGFTLIELVVVIAIMAILALIIVPNLSAYIDKADDAKIMANLKTFHTSSEMEDKVERKDNWNTAIDGKQLGKQEYKEKVADYANLDSEEELDKYSIINVEKGLYVTYKADKREKLYVFPEEFSSLVIPDGGGGEPGDDGGGTPPIIKHTYEKHSVIPGVSQFAIIEETPTTQNISTMTSTNKPFSYNYTFNPTTGAYSSTGSTFTQINESNHPALFYQFFNNDKIMRKYVKQSQGRYEAVYKSSSHSVNTITTSPTKGNFIETIETTSPTEFPEDGIKDGFWYVKK